MLIVFIGIYHPLAYYFNEGTTNKSVAGIPLVIMHLLFTLVGFGLLLTNSYDSKWTGMAVAIFVVSFNFIFSPFIQKFWF